MSYLKFRLHEKCLNAWSKNLDFNCLKNMEFYIYKICKYLLIWVMSFKHWQNQNTIKVQNVDIGWKILILSYMGNNLHIEELMYSMKFKWLWFMENFVYTKAKYRTFFFWWRGEWYYEIALKKC